MIAEPRTFTPIPTGSYAARVMEVEPTEGRFGPQWRWTFHLGNVENVDGDVEEKTLTYYTPNYISSKNKLGKMLAALRIPIDEPFNSDDLIGRTVTLSVVEAVREDGSVGNNIDAVLPPRKKKVVEDDDEPAQPKRATKATTADEDEPPF